MLCFIDNFQLFYYNKKFIKRTWFLLIKEQNDILLFLLSRKGICNRFFPMILLAIVFLFCQSLHATLSSCDLQ